jgi:hypothetical protein
MNQLLIIIFLSLGFPIICHSQESETFTPPCLEFARRDVVFTGTVKKIEKDFAQIVFVIDRKFKAPAELKTAVNSELAVRYPFGEQSYELIVGQRYLVYASYDKTRNNVFIPLYSRTGKIDLNDYDLKYINSRVKDRHTLIGQLIKLDENYAKTVQVTVRDKKGNQFKPEVDKWGIFETKPLKAGKYSVKLIFPFRIKVDKSDDLTVKSYSQLTEISYTEQVESDKCSYREILVSQDN